MNAFFIVIFVICGIYMLLNFKHDIHMLQQNSYRLERYWKYIKTDMSNNWRLAEVAMLFLVMSTMLDVRLSLLFCAVLCLYGIYWILTRKFKKPLVFTLRVWRIYAVTGVLAVGGVLAVLLSLWQEKAVWGSYNGLAVAMATLLLITVFSWAVVCIAVVILMPVEKMINRKYWNEASRILKGMPDLTVIGITGSYGKTSTKHYLNRILSEEFEVLMTPGSYNTTMGVIRTVREMLKPYDRIFICEMGAKQKGDIKEICDLVHPQIGIVTAVGPMHLETFKSMENIRDTKFELIDSLPTNGFAVVNNDFSYSADRIVANVECNRYSVEKDKIKGVDYYAKDIKYDVDGTSFIVKGPDGVSMPFTTKLVGSCNISNLLAAIIVALRLGMKVDKIRYAVAKIDQVEHRLSIKRTPAGVTIIDDAFNSNPSGSKMALEVLASMSSGKRIVVTPGMIELGDRQVELNEEFGRNIAKSADIAIVVGLYNRDAISKGLADGKLSEEKVYKVDSFTEAQKVLSDLLEKGDTILYENDLPDSFK